MSLVVSHRPATALYSLDPVGKNREPRIAIRSLFQSLPRASSCSNQLRVYTMAAYHATSQNILEATQLIAPACSTRPQLDHWHRVLQAAQLSPSPLSSLSLKFELPFSDSSPFFPRFLRTGRAHAGLIFCGSMVRCTQAAPVF